MSNPSVETKEGGETTQPKPSRPAAGGSPSSTAVSSRRSQPPHATDITARWRAALPLKEPNFTAVKVVALPAWWHDEPAPARRLEREAEQALKEVEAGGRLYTFEEVFPYA